MKFKGSDVVVKFKGVELKGAVLDGDILISNRRPEVDWVALVAKVDLSGFPVPITIRLEPGRWETTIVFSMRVKDRTTGKEGPLLSLNVPPSWIADERAGLDWLRRMLRDFVLHELDECLLFGGVRVFDPHPKMQEWKIKTLEGVPTATLTPAERDRLAERSRHDEMIQRARELELASPMPLAFPCYLPPEGI